MKKMKFFKKMLGGIIASVMCCSMSIGAFAMQELPDKTIWYGDELSVDVVEGEDGYTYMSVCKYGRAYYELSGHLISANTHNRVAGPQLFVMIDTTEDYENNVWSPDGLYSYGKSNYEVLYCSDVKTDYRGDVYYKRVNLEDSSYYDEDAAAHIRAIVTNSYPYVSIADMKNNLAAAGFKDAAELTRGDIITSVQAAIWSYSNDEEGDWYKYARTYHVPAVSLWGGVLHDFTGESEIWWSTSGYSTNEAVAARINSLTEFLKNLEPVKAEGDEIVISDLQIMDFDAVANREDVYTVDLKLVLNTSAGAQDGMKLEVLVDDTVSATENVVVGIEEYSMTVEAKKGQTIKAVVSGTQHVERGVYFYEPKAADVNGDGIATSREASQNMVGVAAGMVDIYAESSITFLDRVLQFHKEADVAGKQTPLQGIQFDIYYVGTVEEYNNELIADANNAAKYENPTMDLVNTEEDYIATVTTDASGNAVYNLTENGHPDGIYLIVEKEHDAIKKPLDPFLVTVPMTSVDDIKTEENEAGNPDYFIELDLKNDVVKPVVEKDVTEINQNEDSKDVGENLTWIIRGDILKDMAKASLYRMKDVLDYRLTYNGNLVVKVEKVTDKANNSNEGDNVLIADTDYKLTVTPENVDVDPDESVKRLEEIKTVVVELTEDGRVKVANMVADLLKAENAELEEGATPASIEDYELRVYFDACIDEDAEMGEEILNTVNLEYTNSANFEWNVVPETPPVVYTCGINIKKYDAKDAEKFLDGAEFMLARKATQAELADDTVETSTLVIGRGKTADVVFVDFYNNAKLTGPKVQSVLTDKDGDAMIYGIKEMFETDADGNLVKDDEGNPVTAKYYLVETKAPEGYNLLSYPVEVIVNRDSHVTEDDLTTPDVNEDMTVRVANSNRFELPSTGGIGTTIFTLAGAALTLGAGAVLVGKKRKEKTEE